VIDDFDDSLSMEDIARVCQSVGFNTIPSWLRPFSVLSNGEKFRVEIARRLLSSNGIIAIDEFTSVVDRQVARFGSFAVAKYVRASGKRLVAASCHYDIIDWLQPDWILEPGRECKLTWRSLQQRPPINVSISRVKYEAWPLFRDFHYMSQELNRAARCYGLFASTPRVELPLHDDGLRPHPNRSDNNTGDPGTDRVPSSGSENRVRDTNMDFPTDNIRTGTESRIASMCGVLHRPHPKVTDICGFTRMVTIPDFQGLGLAFVLANTVASAYKAMGKRLHSYPNHPAWIRSYQRSKTWLQIKQTGEYSPRRGSTSSVSGFGNKKCAVFMYIGPAMNRAEAERLIYPEGGRNDD